MAFNFKSEEEVKDYIKNIGIEYRFGCFKENKPQACHLLGDYLETIDKNFDKAWKVYLNNCDEGNYGKSCLKCGNYLAMGRGGAKKDNTKAVEYYEKSCNLGDMTGCFRAGVLSTILSSSQTPFRTFKQAIELLDKACQGNVNEACFHLSGIFMEGHKKENIGKDMKRSFDYSLKACELDNMYACANLSRMYDKGDGVEKNPELARKYRKKAEEMQEEVKSNRTLTFQEGLSRT